MKIFLTPEFGITAEEVDVYQDSTIIYIETDYKFIPYLLDLVKEHIINSFNVRTNQTAILCKTDKIIKIQ